MRDMREKHVEMFEGVKLNLLKLTVILRSCGMRHAACGHAGKSAGRTLGRIGRN